MRKHFRSATFALILLILVGCSPLLAQPLGEVGQLAAFEGEVTAIDLSPMAYDGPAEIELASADHGQILLLVQPCFGGCSPEAVALLDELQVGQYVSGQGQVRASGKVSLFEPEAHWLELVAQP